ncbi:bifunctional methylenetetrahydrofolate dehydrogenase/methenyltetrahydrofolate cyclohydrolase, partial [Escherichia coli]|nr:bifunctional methylenetetrahydrofolate dehydrogenase/methenyltetrahydrofolate cyclohydrolase [Escherichia coli]
REAVVVGRSNLVGKPLALLLLRENATVTVCHSRTRDLAEVTRRAEVLVVAAGRREMIGAEHVREGAVVVDVGIHRTEDG